MVSLLEQQYNEFCKSHNLLHGSVPFQFIGINLNNNVEHPYSFKLYRTLNKEIFALNELVYKLDERKMIRCINSIDDSLYNDCIRYEIALMNRTNENMEWLFNFLGNIMPPAIRMNLENILEILSSIKITNNTMYKNAAIFFIGFIVKKISSRFSDIKNFKLYYLLRKCININDIGNNFEYNNDFFINKLEQSGIKQFSILLSIVKPLIQCCKCNLWIASIDFLSDGSMKYKIYLKGYHFCIYLNIMRMLMSMGEDFLAKQIIKYKNWIVTHPELEQYGMALSIDSKSILTINLYH